jgi:hypothetical protein
MQQEISPKPLTINSKELDINYEGFSERKINVIKDTFLLFQHFSFGDSNSDTDFVKMDGIMINWPDYIYYIYKIKKGIHVQVCKRNGFMLFGVFIEKDVKSTNLLAYHHGMAADFDDEL